MPDSVSGLRIIINNKDKYGFLKIFETIHDYLGNNCQLVFVPYGLENDQRPGIKISQYNEDKTILVKMILEAVNLDYFYCDKKYVINVDICALINYVKKNKKDAITIFLDDNTNSLCIDKTNHVISTETNAECYMVQSPKTEFDVKLQIDIYTLNNVYKTMASNGCQFVNMIVDDSNVIFKNEKDTEIKISHNQNRVGATIIDSLFDLKKLETFCKHNISSPVEIYIKNDFPLVKVAGLPYGKVYVFISQI